VGKRSTSTARKDCWLDQKVFEIAAFRVDLLTLEVMGSNFWISFCSLGNDRATAI